LDKSGFRSGHVLYLGADLGFGMVKIISTRMGPAIPCPQPDAADHHRLIAF